MIHKKYLLVAILAIALPLVSGVSATGSSSE
jgi:hypothetical protein